MTPPPLVPYFLKVDFGQTLRRSVYRLSVAVEAACRAEAPPELLARWLLGDADHEPVLTPALWQVEVHNWGSGIRVVTWLLVLFAHPPAPSNVLNGLHFTLTHL